MTTPVAEKIKQDFENLDEKEKQSLLTYAKFLTRSSISNCKDDENEISLWKLLNDDLFSAKLKLDDILNIIDILFYSLDTGLQSSSDCEKSKTLVSSIEYFVKDAIRRIDKVMETPLKNIVI